MQSDATPQPLVPKPATRIQKTATPPAIPGRPFQKSGTPPSARATLPRNAGTTVSIFWICLFLGIALAHPTASGLHAAPAEGQILNLSARGKAGKDSAALIAGFTLQGTGEARLLLRAAGPSLVSFGISAPLQGVRIDLFRGAQLIASNAGWDSGTSATEITAVSQAVGAFPLKPGPGDAALILSLPAGIYTAIVRPNSDTLSPGITLFEIYDTAPDSRIQLSNLSARASIEKGDDALFAGLVVSGNDGQRFLVRGCGPSLANFGVSPALPDPQLELQKDGDLLAYNDSWLQSTDTGLLSALARDSGAFALTASGADAALIANLSSGTHTITLSDRTSASGIGLIEIYATGSAATLPSPSTFDLLGFARLNGGVTGGGSTLSDYNPATRTGNFWRISSSTTKQANFASQFRTALASDQPLVVELNTMIDLSKVGTADTRLTAIAHPALFAAGKESGSIGTIALGANKTIYSSNGAGGFRRGKITITGKSNIMLRNLRFRELWEWDDATTGDYDRNDWDYLTLASSTGSNNAITARTQRIWIDHCDFEKSYDGLLDVVRGSNLVTISWCRFAGAVSGESRRWLEQQMEYLEANQSKFPYYAKLRQTQSAEALLLGAIAQMKGNLVGNGYSDTNRQQDSGYLNLTLHHNAYIAVDQRQPRLRFGNAHVFGLLSDDSLVKNIAGLTLYSVAATSGGAIRVEDSLFVDVRSPIVNTIGSESVGRISLSNSINLDSTTLLQVAFNASVLTPAGTFTWNQPATDSGINGWPGADNTRMPDGYYPPNRTYQDYRTPAESLRTPYSCGGVIIPASAAETALLRRYLTTATPSETR